MVVAMWSLCFNCDVSRLKTVGGRYMYLARALQLQESLRVLAGYEEGGVGCAGEKEAGRNEVTTIYN